MTEKIVEIGYKDKEVFESAFVKPWHPKLIELAWWVYGLDIEMIFTCLYEKRDYPSVHSLDILRGFDLRSSVIRHPRIIEDMTNDHWIYDPKRPSKRVCMWHNTGRGIHFHFQVHNKTQKNAYIKGNSR